MQLPTLLSRRRSNVHKNTFGHVLILAGSKHTLGAGALSSLACMRSGAGLTTLGVPKSLNSIAQKKSSNVVMTLSLSETKEQSLSFASFKTIQELYEKFDCIAIGPGCSTNKSTQRLIRAIVKTSTTPLVIDADAINALKNHQDLLIKTKTPKILTPHPGEMARIMQTHKSTIENNRKKIAQKFAKNYKCTLLLKGSNTIVASLDGQCYINKTGNAGMATAGSGDVLTGMIAAFFAQGLPAFDAAKYGAFLHGKAGDLASKSQGRLSMIASDIINHIPKAIKSSRT